MASFSRQRLASSTCSCCCLLRACERRYQIRTGASTDQRASSSIAAAGESTRQTPHWQCKQHTITHNPQLMAAAQLAKPSPGGAARLRVLPPHPSRYPSPCGNNAHAFWPHLNTTAATQQQRMYTDTNRLARAQTTKHPCGHRRRRYKEHAGMRPLHAGHEPTRYAASSPGDRCRTTTCLPGPPTRATP
jgi:hypothetical protein